jgi:3',5'-cyclic AMP phosphodiesterase CpdA
MCLEAINHLNNLDQKVDLVLVTGDIVDEGSVEEYATAVTSRLTSR